jgi:hypothetical protein
VKEISIMFFHDLFKDFVKGNINNINQVDLKGYHKEIYIENEGRLSFKSGKS